MTYSTPEEFLQPVLQWRGKKNLWGLYEDYTQEYGPPGHRKRLFMAAGYEYDKASVPRGLWAVARPDGPWEGPSLWHDKLYQEKGEFHKLDFFRFETQMGGIWRVDPGKWKRAWADDLLADFAILAGVDPVEANKYKWAVKSYPPNWFKGF